MHIINIFLWPHTLFPLCPSPFLLYVFMNLLLLCTDAKTQPLSTGAKWHLRDRVLGEAEKKNKRDYRVSMPCRLSDPTWGIW